MKLSLVSHEHERKKIPRGASYKYDHPTTLLLITTSNRTAKQTSDIERRILFNIMMKVVLISCLLVLIATDGGLGCFPTRGGGGSGGGHRTRPTENKNTITVPSCCPESSSPCGGPSQNSGAAVCYFYRSSQKVKCIKDDSVHTCDVATATDSLETDPKGPTPYGEYLIGKHRFSTNYKGLDWFNLYPKMEDDSGYYGYFSATKKGRSQMGLHPGTVSWGCVTVYTPHCSTYSCFNSNSCWTSIKNIVNSGHMNYKGYSYSGILYVV